MASLLDAIGGPDAIELIVAGLWERVHADPELRLMFRDVGRNEHEARLARFLVLLLDDAVNRWDGRDLRGVHVDLAIDQIAFDRFLDCLTDTLDAAGVSARLASDVRARVAALGSMFVL